MTRRTARTRPLAAILGIPTALAICTAIGLGAGLMGDGGYDAVAAMGLGLSFVAMGWGLVRSRQ